MSRFGRLRGFVVGLISVFLALPLVPALLWGQTSWLRDVPRGRTQFLVAGYGTAGWQATTTEEIDNTFFGSVSPLLLFQFGERFLYEGELEFEIEEGATRTGLEYAQIDFLLNDNFVLVGGKFLLPFGVFGERLHPTWINRFPTNPPIFGHGAVVATPLLPILADFGVMVRGSWHWGTRSSLTGSLFVTQGPRSEVAHSAGEGEAMDAVGPEPAVLSAGLLGTPEEGEHAPLPEFEFGESGADNNDDKLVGARVGWVIAPAFELAVSLMTGAYDDAAEQRLTGWNVAAEYRRGRTELRGEILGLRYDVEAPHAEEPMATAGPLTVAADVAGVEEEEKLVTATAAGYYVQAARRIGPWEAVLRWTQMLDVKAEGFEPRKGYTQIGFGLNYWFAPHIALMAGYEINRASGEGAAIPDRLVVHWSFGF